MQHSPIRNYYIARNHLFLLREYKFKFRKKVMLINHYYIKQLIKIILFDDKPFKKIQHMFRGIKDGLFKKIEKKH